MTGTTAAEAPHATHVDGAEGKRDDANAENSDDGAAMSLGSTARRLEASFNAAIEDGDASTAVAAVLDLDAAIVEWSADTLQSDEMDQARRSLRSMIVKLGAAATDGLRDPRAVLGPVVEAALDARRVAREEGRTPCPTQSATDSMQPASKCATPPMASSGSSAPDRTWPGA